MSVHEWWKDAVKLREVIEREGPNSPRIDWLKWKLILAEEGERCAGPADHVRSRP